MLRRSANVVNFTLSSIDSFTVPDSGRQYHYNLRVPGLAICITAAGTRTFYVARRIGRKYERIRIGGWPPIRRKSLRVSR